jgi:O-acetyl-ADP-ribose deacetylase (regulator of RNase III)
MQHSLITGDLLEQPVEAIVNPWNQNILPWWLLLPHGISGAIKKRGGLDPFRELTQQGRLTLGSAVHTSAGKLSCKYIIHVASISILGNTSAATIRACVTNAFQVALSLGVHSVAFPIIGAGSAGYNPSQAEQIMVETIQTTPGDLVVYVVRFKQ